MVRHTSKYTQETTLRAVKAVDDIVNEENKNTITGDIELCLNYDAKDSLLSGYIHKLYK